MHCALLCIVLPQVLRQAGRPSEAQSLSEEALSLLQGQLGSEHPRVAAQLMILGQLVAQQNKQALAEQTFRKALQVGPACMRRAVGGVGCLPAWLAGAGQPRMTPALWGCEASAA